jgi:hypothetical protein
MGRPTRLQVAKDQILEYFNSLPNRVLRLSDLRRILTEERGQWQLAKSTTPAGFMEFLTEQGSLRKLHFPFPHREETRYTWGEVPLLEVVASIKPEGYFSHYTAMRLHGLTEQIPKTIYLNHEQAPHTPSDTLDQRNVDNAFRSKPRVSNNVVDFGSVRICLVNGMYTNAAGVITETLVYDDNGPARVRVTDLERTLIDIAVRPVYSGGVGEVAKAYELAKGRASVNRLVVRLRSLGYAYPYHQAIGFYLERAGYNPTALSLLREMPMRIDFYLTHQMRETHYVPHWRLFVPKGF